MFPFDAELTSPQQVRGRRTDTYNRWMEVVFGATMAALPAIRVPAGFDARGRRWACRSSAGPMPIACRSLA
ncbi:hypothetical protein [Variovorax soli]|uniref:Uncharacterized protein n=1 Tax=Variovorax soli TaxID=376815 RepID=A0ABU1NLQ4_9BURK|nr:hypothetical protein [Variovorax soli]MDR6539278.1 hypothetical protein [Variovorax soli]